MKQFLPLFLLSATVVACDAMTAHTGVVARVGQYELTVDRTVDLLAPHPRVPATTEITASLADLWVDYTILADLMARDPELARVNFEPMVEPYVEQRTFMELRDQVMTHDTIIDDDELRRLYEEQAPGRRVRARHILLRVPDDASQDQREAIHQQAEEIRQRAVEGEDFAELARRYSEDPGSGPQGGDLGWFGQGNMVAPFEEAAFRLQPGEISEVTETLFGLHIIKVDERETPAFDEQREQFRRQVADLRRHESLSDYVDTVTQDAGVTVEKGAVDVARDLASRRAPRLTGRAAARELVTWRGGAFTAGEFARFLNQLPPQQRAQLAAAPDDQLETVLRDVSVNELVLLDARRRGITVPREEQDSVMELVRTQVVEAAARVGLAGPVQEDEDRADAVRRRVNRLLEGIVSGQQDVLPLGNLPYLLRQQRDWQINERAFPTVVQRVEDERQTQPVQPGPPQMPDLTPPPADPVPTPDPGELDPS
jgi:peptidyl-prolyl cis-trans isomerase C